MDSDTVGQHLAEPISLHTRTWIIGWLSPCVNTTVGEALAGTLAAMLFKSPCLPSRGLTRQFGDPGQWMTKRKTPPENGPVEGGKRTPCKAVICHQDKSSQPHRPIRTMRGRQWQKRTQRIRLIW